MPADDENSDGLARDCGDETFATGSSASEKSECGSVNAELELVF